MFIGGIETSVGDRVLAAPMQYTRTTFETGELILARAMLHRPWHQVQSPGTTPRGTPLGVGSSVEQFLPTPIQNNWTSSTLGAFA